MIYGPFSTGWRDEETARKERRAGRIGAVVGIVLLVVSGVVTAWALRLI